MITLNQVSKKHGKNKIITDVSFQVQGGEFVVITGPSGSGKTTLLHLLTAIEKPDSGTLQVDQFQIEELSEDEIQKYRRQIGIIFQDYKLLLQKTVFENVAFALEVAGFNRHFVEERTIAVLRLTGLESKRNNFPRELSAGEKQRVAIARALVHAPELLFADEPTGNLDPENISSLAKLFKKINKSGTTIILATHNQELVKMLGERTIKL